MLITFESSFHSFIEMFLMSILFKFIFCDISFFEKFISFGIKMENHHLEIYFLYYLLV